MPRLRMTMRRWMILVADCAPDPALIAQRASHPLAAVAFLGTMIVIPLSPVMWLLLVLASED